MAFVWVLLTVLCLLVEQSSAHNWITSPSRANQGGLGGPNSFNGFTSPPCPQKGGRAVTQVAAGQRFPIEWASGHGFGSYTYMVVLKSEDEIHMQKHNKVLLDDYLDKAPHTNYMSDTWAMHVTHAGASTAASVGAEITVEYARPSIFRAMPDARAYNKTAAAVADDRRAQYDSEEYPWIISAHMFRLHEDFPEEMDAAYFEIPVGFPSGEYVVQYLWNGYYDCMDINVLDELSTDLFGGPVDGSSLERVDHCMFTPSLENYAVRSSCFGIQDGGTIETCSDLCLDNDNCDGVQVVPYTIPSTARFPSQYFDGPSHLPCEPPAQSVSGDKAHVCWTVSAGDTEVGPSYKIVSDPDDPVFYSTCYFKKPAWAFEQLCSTCAPQAPEPSFTFGRKCISCTTLERNKLEDAVPVWELVDDCQNCDANLG